MDYSEMIGLMVQYNLTLRHIPEKEVSYHIARDKELDPTNLKPNQELVVWNTWKDGISRTMVKTSRPRIIHEWYCLIDRSFGNTQIWNSSFGGDTPEEAIMRAVEHIKNSK